jgi:Na+/proline symporter
VKGMNVEFATMIITLVMGSYSYIGGLGATFYVSYFNTGVIFIATLVFVFKVYLDPVADSRLGEFIPT